MSLNIDYQNKQIEYEDNSLKSLGYSDQNKKHFYASAFYWYSMQFFCALVSYRTALEDNEQFLLTQTS